MIGISLGYSNSKHSEKGRIIRLLDPHPYNFVYQESNDALSRSVVGYEENKAETSNAQAQNSRFPQWWI